MPIVAPYGLNGYEDNILAKPAEQELGAERGIGF
jgi:hypothetical protein